MPIFRKHELKLILAIRATKQGETRKVGYRKVVPLLCQKVASPNVSPKQKERKKERIKERKGFASNTAMSVPALTKRARSVKRSERKAWKIERSCQSGTQGGGGQGGPEGRRRRGTRYFIGFAAGPTPRPTSVQPCYVTQGQAQASLLAATFRDLRAPRLKDAEMSRCCRAELRWTSQKGVAPSGFPPWKGPKAGTAGQKRHCLFTVHPESLQAMPAWQVEQGSLDFPSQLPLPQ